MIVNHKEEANTHIFDLDNGAVITVSNVDWKYNKILADVKVLGDAGTTALGGGRINFADNNNRYRLSQELANHNGGEPKPWADDLIAIWDVLDETRKRAAERFDPVDLSAFDEPAPLKFIVDRLFPDKFASPVVGDGGSTKSTTGLELSICVQQGWPFLGLATIQTQVLFLDWELNQDRTLDRLYKIARGHGLTNPPPILYQAMTEPLETHITDISDYCHNASVGLVIIDSLGPAAGADPNDANAFIRIMGQMRKLDCAHIPIDHQAKTSAQNYASKLAIGSVYKHDLARGGVQLELVDSIPGQATVLLRQKKHNFTALQDPIGYRILYGSNTIRFEVADLSDDDFQDVDVMAAKMKVERFIRDNGPSTIETIQKKTGLSEGTINNNITKLRKDGKLPVVAPVNPGGKKVYELQ